MTSSRVWFYLTDSVDMSQLDASFNEADGMLSLQSFYAQLLLFLQLAPSIKSCKLWCQAGALLWPVPQAGKMSASKLIYYFSVIQLYLDSRLLCDLIISL